MTVFGNYAQFYDVLYQEKDYSAECDYLEKIFTEYAQKPVRRILDLGCGTGGHSLELAQRGFITTSVDISQEMLDLAEKKSVNLPIEARPHFLQGDIRNFSIEEKYDAVISMFAVMGYMTKSDDLLSAFCVARNHLIKGGLFCFDTWYGPAVLTQKPVDRLREIELEKGISRVLRFAHPEMDFVNQTVTVHYLVLHLERDKILSEIREEHQVRFCFSQEIEWLLKQAKFRLVQQSPFLQFGETLTDQNWNMEVIAEAIDD